MIPTIAYADAREPFAADGLYTGVPDEIYFAEDNIISASGLKRGAESWRKFAALQDAPDDEESEALKFGRLFHPMLLEGKTPEQAGFIVKPEGMTFVTKEGKAWRDVAESTGRSIVKFEEVEAAKAMIAAIRRDETAKLALGTEGFAEIVSISTDDVTGLRMRSKIDWLPAHGTAIVDAKSCVSAHPSEWPKVVLKRGYHIQAAFYRRNLRNLGEDRSNFVFVAVEKKFPYEVATYSLGEDWLEEGDREVERLLREYAECESTGIWPGPARGVVTLEMPGWAKRRSA